MRILVVRHAPAGNRAAWAAAGRPDAPRPLTTVGARKMRRAVEGLVRIAPSIDLLAASPYARAKQTADILAEAFPKARRIELEALAPSGDRREVLNWLGVRPANAAAALVGHEPQLGLLLAELLRGRPEAFTQLKKGACALVEVDGRKILEGGLLRWLLQPAQLRALA